MKQVSFPNTVRNTTVCSAFLLLLAFTAVVHSSHTIVPVYEENDEVTMTSGRLRVICSPLIRLEKTEDRFKVVADDSSGSTWEIIYAEPEAELIGFRIDHMTSHSDME